MLSEKLIEFKLAMAILAIEWGLILKINSML
jgi:hypothetical protein